MTDNPDNYLCFCVDGIYYIVSVMDVERICLLSDAGEEEQLRWLKLGETSHTQQQQDCVVILREGTNRYGIVTESVDGIMQIQPGDQYELPKSLHSVCPWILGMAIRREEHRLLLLIDVQKLSLLTDGEI